MEVNEIIKEVTSKNGHQTPRRHLAWPKCYNTRDLGGLPTMDGKETRWQAVTRSDTLSRLTGEGRQALLDYGIRTIIDLRAPKEVQEQPSAFTKQTDNLSGPACLNLPLEKYYPHVSALINQATTRAEVYCIILDHYPDAVANVMRAIADAQSGGVVIHCHGGKDRTGIVSALLLSLADVPAETIAADYAESQARLWPLYEKIIAEAGGEDEVGFWLKPTATEEMMYMMLEHMDTKYSGVEPYLRASGLSSREIDQLKNRLRST